MNAIGRINVYVCLTSGKMIEVPWSDEWDSGEFSPQDAAEQCAQRVRAGGVVYGRLIGEDGPDETFRWIAVEPRSVEMVFANA
jgi:hypothetical protein